MKYYQFTKSFEKSYQKLTLKQQEKIDDALISYLETPDLVRLRVHRLKGRYLGQISISAGGDLRIHLKEEGDTIIVVVTVGTHSQLY